MQNASFIRNLYQPRQPMANASGSGELYYQEASPVIALRPFVYCFWELRTNHHLDNLYTYRVVADGCIDLIADTHSFNGMFIAGIADTSFDVPLNGVQSYFGIRFLPGGIHSFFPLPAGSIRNLMIPVQDIAGKKMNELSQLVYEANSFSKRIEAAGRYLLELLNNRATEMHPGLACALHHILQTGGNLPIQKKAADWISPRQLRRLFHEQIGCHPKLFSRIVRFQKALATLQANGGKDRIGAFYHHGYFDQAHFIRDFKTFSGFTPSLFDRAPTLTAVGQSLWRRTKL